MIRKGNMMVKSNYFQHIFISIFWFYPYLFLSFLKLKVFRLTLDLKSFEGINYHNHFQLGSSVSSIALGRNSCLRIR